MTAYFRPAVAGLLTLAGAGSIAATRADAQQSVEQFYRGKTVTYNLAVPDGGSWGVYARTLAEHLKAHIPGNPTIIVQTMPGAGGVLQANFMYNVAPKDGTLIATPLSTAMVFAALNPAEVKFDATKFNWIGSLAVVQDVISVWHTASASTLAEAQHKPLLLGATGRGSNTFEDIAMANNLLGTQFKLIMGYAGGAEINIAMERGEVQGRATTWDSWVTSNGDWLRDKKLVHLVQIGPRKLPEIGADVPLFRDLAKNQEDRELVDLLGLSLAMGRALYLPPATPQDRVAALSLAFEQTMQDPDYIAQAKQRQLDTETWQRGPAIKALVDHAFALPPDVKAKAKAAIDLKTQ